MKIIVAIKQVPDRDTQVRIDAAGKWILESDLQYALNEPDAYALEEALQLKEKHGGEVIVRSAWEPPSAKPSPRAPIAPFTSFATTSALAMHSALPAFWPPPRNRKIRTSSSSACSQKISAWARPASS